MTDREHAYQRVVEELRTLGCRRSRRLAHRYGVPTGTVARAIPKQ